MELGGGKLGDLGKWIGRDVATLSSAVKRLQIRAQKDLNLARRMRNCWKQFLKLQYCKPQISLEEVNRVSP